tara:strand:+ start:1074 stop:1607 length:534 start_codon:yes stop_codon:yes gene_type:complete
MAVDQLFMALIRIAERTEIDLENKSPSDLVLSLIEECGEFSRELKIEEGVFGNSHKKADPKDGSRIELKSLKVGSYFSDEESGNRLMAALEECAPRLVKNKASLGDKLEAFKKEIGEDHYILISDTDNFMPMFEKWEKESAERNTTILTQAIKSALPEDHSCDTEDIHCFISQMLEQ